MAEHDDAVSPTGERASHSSGSVRLPGPLGKAWSWFNAQPAQTKVIVLGVIVVLGIVVWMAFRKTPATGDTTSEDSQGTPQIGRRRFGDRGQAVNGGPLAGPGSTPTPINGTPGTPIGDMFGSAPVPTAAPTATPAYHTGESIPASANPSLLSPAILFPATPAGMSTPTMRRTDVSLSGTITPLTGANAATSTTMVPSAPNKDETVTAQLIQASSPATTATYTPTLGAAPQIGESTATRTTSIYIAPKPSTPTTYIRPTVISSTPTQRGTNVSY